MTYDSAKCPYCKTPIDQDTNDPGIRALSTSGTCNVHARFDVEVSYQDLDGREYKHKIPVLIADDAGFAGGHWEDPQRK